MDNPSSTVRKAVCVGDYISLAATAPQDMGPTALEQARREYAADKRLALERRRARMMAEEGAARA